MAMLRAGLKGGRRSLPRKVAGIVLAVAGIALIVNNLPPFLWWVCLGTALVFAGWRLFTV
ncbi:MAG TPA: hypothetical protein PKL39_05785 [Bacillota bacterium]|jgi:drug/metabolite transporter (DMT)-like permease|nr:hypothetical protein [Bacillota bacterium]HPZ89867.1 hypothetical protein [Bacillota bacterium]HQE01117.1 hypothetical protein [Bacillota bacterium]